MAIGQDNGREALSLRGELGLSGQVTGKEVLRTPPLGVLAMMEYREGVSNWA